MIESRAIAIFLTLLFVVACGGGGGVGEGSSVQVGQFIDDPVSGLTYKCTGGETTNTGVTNDRGEFNYSSNQNCIFSIGNVTLGQSIGVPIDGKVTPQDVVGVPRSSTEITSVLVIAQFLQSLNDGAPQVHIFTRYLDSQMKWRIALSYLYPTALKPAPAT